MSAIHHVCCACFEDEHRGFTFTGTLPVAGPTRCPACGDPMYRVVRLSRDELSDRAAVAYDGRGYVVREPRWEAIRHRIEAAVADIEDMTYVRRSDGLIELFVRDTVSLLLQAVVDHISGMEGCLVACCILDADGDDATTVRNLLGELNDIFGTRSLLLGSLRDLFPLEEPRATVIYRRFIPGEAVDAGALPLVVRRAGDLVLFVHEALRTFGFSPAAVRFLRNLGIGDHIAEVISSATVLEEIDRLGFGVRSLDALLDQTDDARVHPVDHGRLRRYILEFLRALDIDIGSIGDEQGGLALYYGDVNISLSMLADARDSYLRASAKVVSGLLVDAEIDATLMSLSRGLVMGDLVVRPDQAHPGCVTLVLQDTILGNDLNVDELARVLANIAQQARTFRESLSAGIAPAEPALGAPIDGLLSFLNQRAAQQSRTPNLPRLLERVGEYLTALNLQPRISPTGDYLLRYDGVDVSMHLGEVVPDSYLTVRARVVPRLGVAHHEVWKTLAVLDMQPMVGGFRLPGDGSLTFEDTILGNSLDLNELAKTLHAVVTTAVTCRDWLREQLSRDAGHLSDPPALVGVRGATEGLATLYRRSYDIRARTQAVQALSMFSDVSSRECLFSALADPASEVADQAAAGLVVDMADGRDALVEPLVRVALDTGLSDRARRRAIRILGAARGPIEVVLRALREVALSESETSSLRAFAFHAIGALDAPEVARTLVDGVRQSSYLVSHAALQAMATLDLPDPAPLYVAAQEALERVRNRDDHDRATILSTLAQLGMDETVLEMVGDEWERSAEVASAVAEAAAHTSTPRIDILRQMLTHARGELRKVAYQAIGGHKLSDLADDLAEALTQERDERLKPIAIGAIRAVGVLSRRVADALHTTSQDIRLRQQVLDVLHELRTRQMQQLTAGL